MVGPGFRTQQVLPTLRPGLKVKLRHGCGGFKAGLPGVVVEVLDDEGVVFVPMLNRSLRFFRHELRRAEA